MPSSYTTSLRLTLPATGELAGQWGNTVNTGITELLDAAVAGTTTISTWGGAGVAYTLSNNSGTADEARRMFIVATGSPGEAKNVICPAVSKFYVFRNDTTGGFALTLKTPSGTGVSVPAGQYRFLYCDGTNVVEMFNSVASLRLSSLTSGRVTYAGTAGLLQDSANFTFNGTDLTVSGAVNAGSVNATTLDLTNLEVTNIKAKDGTASMTLADATGVATFSANPILNAGTANGVLYLNGSKVATSVSGFTFNGSTLSVGGNVKIGAGAASNSQTLMVNNPSGTATQIQLFQDGIESWTMGMPASSAGLAWAASGTEQMRLTSTGLGIGTSSPVAKLDVNGNQSFGSASYQIGYALNSNTGTIAGANSPFYGLNMATFTGFSGQGVGLHGYYGLLFSTVGTERMRLDSSGNLGIGTSSPLQKLHVATAGNNYIVSSNTAGSTSALLLGAESGQTTIYSWTTVAGSTGRPLAFYTGPSEAMRLDTSGNLGLGVTPSAWSVAFKVLQASGGAVFAGRTDTNQLNLANNWYYDGSNTSRYLASDYATRYLQESGAHKWYTAPSGTAGNAISFTQAMTLFASGNLTIGGTNDSARLRVEGTTNLTTGLQLFRSGNACSALWTETGALRFGVDGSTGFTELMQLNLSGNLGIGTSSPGYRLTAAGASTAGSVTALAIENPSTNAASEVRQEWRAGGSSWSYITTSYNSNSPYMAFGVSAASSAPTERMRLDSSGNLSVGTATAVEKLTVWAGNAYVLRNGGAKLRLADQNNEVSVESLPVGSGSEMVFKSNAVERMRIDNSGNLGLGVTPSAWSGVNGVFEIKGNAYIYSTTGVLSSGANAYFNGTNWIYKTTQAATRYEQVNGQHQWGVAPSGTAGNAISFTQAMTLDASGNLGVGTTSPTTRVYAEGTISARSGTTGIQIYGTGGSGEINSVGANPLIFLTNSSERARITSGGYFKASNDGTYVGSTGSYHEMVSNTASNYVAWVRHTATSGAIAGININYSGQAPNDTANEFLVCGDTGANRFLFRSNGGLANYSGNNVNLSDRREKTNFAPAKSYLDTICAIPVQTFNYIDQSPDDPGLTLGVVAQDVQAVAPELVMESNWGTEDNPKMRLSIYQTDLQYALMKCIQEQQALITALTARVAALEKP